MYFYIVFAINLIFICYFDRVMAPPGGRSNNIFGGYEEEKKTVFNGNGTNGTHNGTNGTHNGTPTSPVKPELTAHQSAAANKYNNIHGTNIFGAVETNTNAVSKPRDNSQNKLFGDVTPVTNEVVKAKKRTGYNPITGQAYEEEDDDKEKIKQAHIALTTANATLESQATVQQQQNAAGTANNYHSSSRVLQPPGGRTTKLW